MASLNVSKDSRFGSKIICKKHYGIPSNSDDFLAPPGKEWSARHPAANRRVLIHGLQAATANYQQLKEMLAAYGSLRVCSYCFYLTLFRTVLF